LTFGQSRSHFFRQLKGRWHTGQILTGSSDFFIGYVDLTSEAANCFAIDAVENSSLEEKPIVLQYGTILIRFPFYKQST